MVPKHMDFAAVYAKLIPLNLFFPLAGFFACIFLSIRYNFDESTATHCEVENYVPSTSSAIGGYTPQSYIWQFAVAIHIPPRIIIYPTAYYSWYSNRALPAPHNRAYLLLARLAVCFHALELIGLLGLSFVTSSRNKPGHQICFGMFMLFAGLYMMLMLILMRRYRKHNVLTPQEKASYWWKKLMFCINSGSFVFALYFYWRHNAYCESGVYSLFALCEYIIVLSNMGFHFTATIDFSQGLQPTPTKFIKTV